MADTSEVEHSRQRAFDGRLLKLDVVQVELPDGKAATREIIVHPGAVAVVAFDDDGRVLLVRQYRTAAQASLLELPAGTLNRDETVEQCAIRELREETGFQPADATEFRSLGWFYTAPGYTTEKIHLYLTQALIAAPLDHDDDEFIELIHMSWNEVLAAVSRGEIHDAKTIVGLLRAHQYLQAQG